jgi:hypothetical protein
VSSKKRVEVVSKIVINALGVCEIADVDHYIAFGLAAAM